MATRITECVGTHSIRMASIINAIRLPSTGLMMAIPTATARRCKCGWLLPGLYEVFHSSDLGPRQRTGLGPAPYATWTLGADEPHAGEGAARLSYRRTTTLLGPAAHQAPGIIIFRPRHCGYGGPRGSTIASEVSHRIRRIAAAKDFMKKSVAEPRALPWDLPPQYIDVCGVPLKIFTDASSSAAEFLVNVAAASARNLSRTLC
ncbi:hypothetical protein SK128_027915 [Halocaridina rubra]|uniref:Uncharacterized protein n=1 Tax=Halocaridina rubra TaxID=373956 RepID=A0AAN8WL38_HALRR